MVPDPYIALGLDRKCTDAQIRAAYRLLVKRHHPDVNADSLDATRRAQELNAAYETLVDPERRAAYDRESAAAKGREKKAATSSMARVERNVAQDVFLRTEDFFRGTMLSVRVNDPANPDGAEVYELAVPEDTAPGQKFRIPREGTMTGGFVTVRVKAMPGPRFKARGSDLRTDLRISAQRAEQGGVEMIAGPTGRMVRVAIPARVSRGAVLRVNAEGLPKARGGRGDLLVRVTYRPEVRITRR